MGDVPDIINSIRAYIELEKASGCGSFFKKGSIRKAAGPVPGSGAEWKELIARCANCKRCGLYKTRQNVVFGSGSVNAGLVFIGEAPGADEDSQGLPFVGRAGQLLTKIIEAIGLKRSEVYIANVLKCRPPGNRPPLPTEVLECEEYLKAQIGLIRPKVICALGKFAAQTLLRTAEPITRLRGRFHEYNGIKLMPTFHPAYLLRNPPDKRLVWQDMKKIKNELMR